MAQKEVVLVLFAIFLTSVAAVSDEPESEFINVTWNSTVENFYSFSKRVVHIYLGDSIRFLCHDSKFFGVEQQTLAQIQACNKSADPASTIRESAGDCLDGTFFIIRFRSASDSLPNVNSYQAGETYYFTSYSPVNATVGDVIADNPSAGGLCDLGAVVEVRIKEEGDPTTDPTVVTTVDNGHQDTSSMGGLGVDSSTDPPNPNVDGPGGTSSMGGPGGTGGQLGNAGGIRNSACGFHSRELSLITALSAALCTFITKLVH